MAQKVPFIRTVGELKKALANIPDDLPLALKGHCIGWGLVPPFVAHYAWGDTFIPKDSPFLEKKNRRPNEHTPTKLLHPVCALHFRIGLDFQHKCAQSK